MSVERPGERASSSELKRWFNNKAVRINGDFPKWDTEIVFPVTEMTLFPNNDKRKCSLQ